MSNFLGKYNNIDVYEYVLKNEFLEIKFLNIGGAITEILLPDKNGNIQNINMAHKDISDYIKGAPNYLGALVGRVSGRVPYSKIIIDEIEYIVGANNNGHSLHGGIEGFSMKSWDVKKADDNAYILKYTSEDGEEGYPGKLEVAVTYKLDGKRLFIDYHASTNKTTAVNMTNHAYFNLSAGKETIQNHKLWANISHYLKSDEKLMATGEILSVKDTFIDFTNEKSLKQDFPEDGYDHCTILDTKRDVTKPIAKLTHEDSGRSITVYTDQSALIIYTDGSAAGGDVNFGERKKFSAICLETQYPNIGSDGTFKDLYILKPEENYIQKTIYQFDVEK